MADRDKSDHLSFYCQRSGGPWNFLRDHMVFRRTVRGFVSHKQTLRGTVENRVFFMRPSDNWRGCWNLTIRDYKYLLICCKIDYCKTNATSMARQTRLLSLRNFITSVWLSYCLLLFMRPNDNWRACWNLRPKATQSFVSCKASPAFKSASRMKIQGA